MATVEDRRRRDKGTSGSFSIPEGVLRSVFEASEVAMLIAAPDGTLLAANRAACRGLGYTEDELVGRHFTELSHPDELPEALERYGALWGGWCNHYSCETRHVRKDGRTVRSLVTVTAIRDEEGMPLYAVVLAQDLTEQHRAIQALRTSEEKYRQLVEQIPDVLFTTDRRGIITYVSPAVQALIGYSPSEVTGHHFTRFLFEEDRDWVERSFERIRADRIRPIEYRLRTKAGQVRWVRAYNRPILGEGGVSGVRGVLCDVTERRLAEWRLRESQERYRTLIQNAHDAIFVIQDGRIRFHNGRTTEVTGYPARVLTNAPFARFLHPEDERAVLHSYERLLAGESVPASYLCRVRHKSGSILELQTTSVRVTWEGRPAVLCFAKDVTKQRELESRLRQAQKMEAIGTLAAGIAHDFNNILAAILGYAELAQLEAGGNTALNRHIDEVLQAAGRAKELVRQILTFSRQTEQDKRPIRPYLVLKEAMGLIRASLPTTIQIRQNLEARSALSLADPTQVHQILMNLCTNAKDAMADKGGVLEVSLTEEDLEHNTPDMHPDLRPGPYLKLTVRDTGCGMDRPVLDRIFDPFFTTKQPGHGTGMGLAMVHGIVKDHGGAIRVQSEPGKGTTFEIYLPRIVRDQHAEPSPSHPETPGNQQTARILLVEDELALVELYRQVLERLGHKVIARTSSLEALEAFRARPDRFDLVLTDMTMPNMTGLDLARQISRIRPGIPVLLCTGFSESITPEKATKAGIQKILMKPVSSADLAAAIRKALGRPQQATRSSHLTILVVDDEEPVRHLLRNMLEPEGYTVLEAPDGRQALRIQEKEPADLIITDIFMPETDGLEMIRALRKDSPATRIIAISGGGGRLRVDLLPQARILGAHRTLAKPIARQELLTAIHELVQNNQTE